MTIAYVSTTFTSGMMTIDGSDMTLTVNLPATSVGDLIVVSLSQNNSPWNIQNALSFTNDSGMWTRVCDGTESGVTLNLRFPGGAASYNNVFNDEGAYVAGVSLYTAPDHENDFSGNFLTTETWVDSPSFHYSLNSYSEFQESDLPDLADSISFFYGASFHGDPQVTAVNGVFNGTERGRQTFTSGSASAVLVMYDVLGYIPQVGSSNNPDPLAYVNFQTNGYSFDNHSNQSSALVYVPFGTTPPPPPPPPPPVPPPDVSAADQAGGWVSPGGTTSLKDRPTIAGPNDLSVGTGNDFVVGDPVTQKKLQDMFHDDDTMNHTKLEAFLRNTKGTLNDAGLNAHRKPPHPEIIKEELAVWADLQRFSFGGSITLGGGNNRPSWRFNDSYFFPMNASGDYFHEDYLPTVVMQFDNSHDTTYPALILTMTNIRTDGVDFLVHQLDDGNSPGSGDHFWLSILAIGRKGDYFT